MMSRAFHRLGAACSVNGEGRIPGISVIRIRVESLSGEILFRTRRALNVVGIASTYLICERPAGAGALFSKTGRAARSCPLTAVSGVPVASAVVFHVAVIVWERQGRSALQFELGQFVITWFHKCSSEAASSKY